MQNSKYSDEIPVSCKLIKTKRKRVITIQYLGGKSRISNKFKGGNEQ